MESIRTSSLRVGNFTSSEIYFLTKSGTREMTPAELEARPKKGTGSRTTIITDLSTLGSPAITYIEDCNEERRLQRPLDNDSNAKPLSYGKIGEMVAFASLDASYTLMSNQTLLHPDFDCWSGSPDVITETSVGDIKSPLTMKSFVTLVKPIQMQLKGIMAMEWLRENHPDGEKYYWQIVSNAILTNKNIGELIVFMPFKSQLEIMRTIVLQMQDLSEQKKCYWIYYSDDEELPWIPDDGYYSNINIIRFEIPESDKRFLVDRVRTASDKLIKRAA